MGEIIGLSEQKQSPGDVLQKNCFENFFKIWVKTPVPEPFFIIRFLNLQLKGVNAVFSLISTTGA